MKVTTSSWSATYDKATNAWSSQDGMIERFLNASCVPKSPSEMGALDAVQTQFPNVAMEIEHEDGSTNATSDDE